MIAFVGFGPMAALAMWTWNTVGSVVTETDLVVQQLANDQIHGELIAAGELQDEKLDRIDANTRIVPRLRDLIRARCMGAVGLQPTIDELKAQYEDLTGDEYDEPTCAEFPA